METSAETIGYRPVSRLAVAAAVAGLVASLALLTPLLWILPLVGIALAIAALADAGRSGAEKAGRAAALCGLALSVGFGVQSVTAVIATRWIAESRSKGVVNAWIDALNHDRLAEAKSMLALQLLPDIEPGVEPGPEGDRGPDGGSDPQIAALPAVRAIRDCGAAAARDLRFSGRDEASGQSWCVDVRLGPCAGGRTVDLRLHLQPSKVRESKRVVERWTIVQIDLAP